MELTQEQIDYCMECGVCTGSCPVSRVLPQFSPRQMIKRAMEEPDGDLTRAREIWACLTCQRCSTRCPVAIDFPEFIRSYRQKARGRGNIPLESHHGMMQSIAQIQMGETQQQRTSWAKGAGEFAEKGDYFYFVGCLPYFEVIFSYLNISPIKSARGVLALLNRMGITPVISNDERCCGHDALWSGNEATFLHLAERNLEIIKSSGARTVIFSCPEGYTTFKDYYPKYLGDLPFEVIHMTELLARELPEANLSFRPSDNGAITYHDPCRLGRGSGLYEEPRELLGLIPEARLLEMGRNRENSLCCGTSAWMECSNCSKAMRIERLNEAIQTGAKTLITACPKCQIHLTCAQGTAEMDLRVTDLYAYLLDRLDKAE
ncbi:MAG: (Fe-S)-binding protein [Deltaproteobacteria bacterium]|nr:(Fe-S)-binding protein [Deltaproteobacteria bacterium]MBW2047559.1 (Fe-S)-binding protein [Deltaproteobacteria bacterium]MBW2111892.1 (Fe-S)-binding protein [Deltaproteobacteria bacterium]MBW2352246.1 (Fe-S)-binding protein [Deltaproteobacteria bacterium]HDZ91470.1 (Fe-S)-binding protein [Deltaproteobacteria bacterium]